MKARYIVGDSLTVLRSLPDASVDLVLSSPPFLGLRSYLPSDDPLKAHEMGSEGTPGAFIDALLDIVEECRRVLAPHGTLALELGDTYAGSGGAGGDYAEGGLRDGQAKFDGTAAKARANGGPAERPRPPRNRWRSPEESRRGVDAKNRGNTSHGTPAGGDWPLDKSLCLIPETLRWAMVYGRNPHTSRETPRWRARNVVRWCRPNPPVGALADKFRPGTSELVVACMERSRYFDLDAVRTPERPDKIPPPEGWTDRNARPSSKETGRERFAKRLSTNGGAPPLDFWVIPTEPYKGSHYATWPTALCTRPIEAMCPRRVCTTCGKPSERIVDAKSFADGKPSTGTLNGRSAVEPWREESPTHQAGRATFSRVATTTGWTDCGHDSWRPGVVLDPFAGSGTTLAVATGHGRAAIGIDLDERNADLARERVGMWLEVEHFREQTEEMERA